MSLRRWMMVMAGGLLASAASNAAVVGSNCLTVTGVMNAESGGAVILALSPAIPGCTPNTIPGVEFAVGSNGVTAANLSSYLASGMLALATGRQVQVIYDNSSSSCLGLQIAVGGAQGQCP